VVADGSFGPGLHLLVWDGRTTGGETAKPGTYFIRLTSGSSSTSHKLVLRQ
jgi:hypothetical protein